MQRWALTHVGMTGAKLKRQGTNAYAVAPNGAGLYSAADGRLHLKPPFIPDSGEQAL